MKLLFIVPPMGNWAPFGDRQLAANHSVMPTKYLTRKQVGELTGWAFKVCPASSGTSASVRGMLSSTPRVAPPSTTRNDSS